jgi:hypothetical protein
MGYTHYWYQKQDCPPYTWAVLVAKARRALAPEVPLLCYEDTSDIPKPGFWVTDNDEIIFNGRGDDSYETFWLNRKQSSLEPWQEHYRDEGVFNCCKTGRAPYDTAVQLVLLLAEQLAPEAYTLKSDGDLLNWLSAIHKLSRRLSEPPYVPQFLRDSLLPTLLEQDLSETERTLLQEILPEHAA